MKKLLLILFLLPLIGRAQRFNCEVLQVPEDHRMSSVSKLPYITGTFSKQVYVYIECDSFLTAAHSNLDAYVRDTLFKAVKQFYFADSINVNVFSVYGWATHEPEYQCTSSSGCLTSFASRMQTSHPAADLFLLLSASPYNLGGAAYQNVLGIDAQWRCAYCNVYLNQPTESATVYNWNTEVVAHELGHNLYSPHTHNCGWNGNSTAIDSLPGYTEGSCVVGGGNIALPPNGGTCMSYGHVTSYGINFALGFGLQPRDSIRGAIELAYQNGKLLYPNGLVVCSPPIVILPIIPTQTTAFIKWNATSLKYRYRYKIVNQAWNPLVAIGTNSVTISGLSPNTKYAFQVKALCGTKWSAWGTIPAYKFKTQP